MEEKTQLIVILFLQAAGLHPTAEQIEMFAYHLPETTLSNLIVGGSSFNFFFLKLLTCHVSIGSLHVQEWMVCLCADAIHEIYIAGENFQSLGVLGV